MCYLGIITSLGASHISMELPQNWLRVENGQPIDKSSLQEALRKTPNAKCIGFQIRRLP